VRCSSRRELHPGFLLRIAAVPAGDSSCGSSTMPLTLEKLKELQEEALADDCEIDMDRMKSWSESQAQ
jgi:hypothetical protein